MIRIGNIHKRNIIVNLREIITGHYFKNFIFYYRFIIKRCFMNLHLSFTEGLFKKI